MPRQSGLAVGWYWELTKPRVVALIVFTAVVGMFLATPGPVPLDAFLLGTLGIALAAGSAAAFNHVLDQRGDAIMRRTRRRPLPSGELTPPQAVIFATMLALISMRNCSSASTIDAGADVPVLIGYAVLTFFL